MDDSAPESDPESAWPGQAPDRAVLVASRLKERIYATITMIAVVVGLANSGHAGPRGAAVTVGVTAVGLWLASVVADGQAHRVVHGRGGGGRQVRETLFVSSPLLLSAVGPLILIALSALGAMELRTALLTAAGVSVWVLFAWGWYGGLRMGANMAVALLAGVADAAIGTVVALVKAAGH
ncbi:hypothetical protein [Streptomyces hesseae]|uniref:ABC transporter permease n=1 Tax=Streptomyces hesseae TaxID=3075519 RepID=A0ABU2SHJ4_9ACTN|nr:hypothetical protein [Streptomyces sp. DSM 40473]MDT0448111.1 hypothetical protein [Streptomyces sp. DSM 40473]